MRSELLLACISGPLLAALLLRGNARRLLAAVSGGMLAAFISGTVSGVLAGIVQYDSMAAVLYISPLVEEGAKLLLFALFFFIWQLQEGETQEIVIGIGIGFSLLESIALLFSSGNASLLAQTGEACVLSIDRLLQLETSAVRFVPLEPEMTTGAYLIWKRYRMHTPACREFLARLRAACPGAPASVPSA